MSILSCFELITANRLGTAEQDSFCVLDRFQVGGQTCLLVAEEWSMLQALEDGRLPPAHGFEETGDQLTPLTDQQLAERYRALGETPGGPPPPSVVTLVLEGEPVRFQEEPVAPGGEEDGATLVALFNVTDDQDVRIALRHPGDQGQPAYLLCGEGQGPEVAALAGFMALRRRLLRTYR